ncbi:MAG: cohesin domain-containing protein, partial [Patescibacteria group bacterium]
MKKIAALFLVLAFVFGSTGISPAQAAGMATLTLSPTNTTVKTGETFSLSVLVNPSGESIDTARVNLSWDGSKLEALAFDLGSLFPDLSPSNSISSGKLTYGAFKFGTPVSSSGTLATVSFRALASGSAVISVASDSKLISDGTEKINTNTLGSATITITGTTVNPVQPVVTPATPAVPATPAIPAANTEAAALKYFGALAGRLPASAEDWVAVKCMVNDACKVMPQDLVKEKQALSFYTKKYNSLPKTSMEWNAIHAIAYTNVFIKWPAATPATPAVPATPTVKPATPAVPATPAKPVVANTEAAALKYFGALAGRLPKTDAEWAALKCMVNDGCKVTPQNTEKEKKALVLYTKKYKGLPKTSMEWNVIHAIAYTNVFIQWTVETPVVKTEAKPVTTPAPAAKTLTVKEQAIGWFGKIYGRLPASTTDWKAVDYMVSGYKPAKQ